MNVVQNIGTNRYARERVGCRLITSKSYLDEVLVDLAGAKERAVVLALLISYDSETRRLFSALSDALARGIEVRLVLDEYYVRMYFAGRANRLQETMATLERLRAAGAVVTRLQPTSFHPFKGRCHTKFTIVDDIVYSFGGTNMADKAVLNNDYMLRVCDRDVANRLYQLCRAIETGQLQDDARFDLGTKSEILLDGGTPGSSVIYDQACELVARASRVYYVSQFCPTGPLARLLRATDARCYFNRTTASAPHIGIMLTVDKAIGRLRTSYRADSYLHAKFILAELPDGERALLSGSHNFKRQGVKYGTMEIALYSTDGELWDQLYDYLTAQIIR